VKRAHAQRVHLELADLRGGELGPPDLHLADDEAAYREGPDRHGAQRQGPDREGAQGPHADGRERSAAIRPVRPERTKHDTA